MRAVVWLDQLKKLHGLPCAGQDFTDCGSDPSECKKKEGVYLGEWWDECPIRSLMDDKRLVAALSVEAQAEINPLCL